MQSDRDRNRSVERKTCVLFDAEHLRRMMLRDRWAAASAYALSFVDYRDCSRGADELNYRLLALRVLKAFAAGQARSVDYLFRRIYACLRFRPDRDRRIAIGRLLLALRSDDTKCMRALYCIALHSDRDRALQIS